MSTSSTVVLLLAVFGASTVEMVEALTIVLAVGVTRGWRSALEGVAVALVVLGVLVVAFGPALVHWVPLSALRLVVGGLLLVFVGRPKIAGIEPGARLVAEGMVGAWGRRPAMLNPSIELMAGAGQDPPEG